MAAFRNKATVAAIAGIVGVVGGGVIASRSPLSFGIAVAGVGFLLLGASLVMYGACGGVRRRWRATAVLCAIVAGLIGIFFVYASTRVHFVRSLMYTHSQLRAVHVALLRYSEEHGGFPSSLSALVKEGHVIERQVQSVFRDQRESPGIGFAYVPGLRPSDPGQWPLVFDLSDTHEDGTRVVLFISGKVRTLPKSEFEERWTRFASEFERSRGHEPVTIEPGDKAGG